MLIDWQTNAVVKGEPIQRVGQLDKVSLSYLEQEEILVDTVDLFVKVSSTTD